MALAEQTLNSFPTPAPGAEYDARREEQHLQSTMAARARVAELEQDVEALTQRADELVEIVDQCGSQFEIAILDDSHHFVCAGYAYIDDGTHVFAPVSPKVRSTGDRLDAIDCTSGGFAIGSQAYNVWLEYDTSAPEVWIDWSTDDVPDDTGDTKYIHIATIPAAAADGSCRAPEMLISGTAWLSGIGGATHPFQIYRTLVGETTMIAVRAGRVNNVLATNAGPWAAAAEGTTQTFWIKTTWAAVTYDTTDPYSLDSATLTAVEVGVGAALPSDTCPEVDETTGALTDGEYYIAIGTQTTSGGQISVENDNVTRSLGATFCPPCEWRNWPAG